MTADRVKAWATAEAIKRFLETDAGNDFVWQLIDAQEANKDDQEERQEVGTSI